MGSSKVTSDILPSTSKDGLTKRERHLQKSLKKVEN